MSEDSPLGKEDGASGLLKLASAVKEEDHNDENDDRKSNDVRAGEASRARDERDNKKEASREEQRPLAVAAASVVPVVQAKHGRSLWSAITSQKRIATASKAPSRVKTLSSTATQETTKTKGGTAGKESLWSAITSRKRAATTTTTRRERTETIVRTVVKGSTATREKRKGETFQAAATNRGRKRGLSPTAAPSPPKNGGVRSDTDSGDAPTKVNTPSIASDVGKMTDPGGHLVQEDSGDSPVQEKQEKCNGINNNAGDQATCKNRNDSTKLTGRDAAQADCSTAGSNSTANVNEKKTGEASQRRDEGNNTSTEDERPLAAASVVPVGQAKHGRSLWSAITSQKRMPTTSDAPNVKTLRSAVTQETTKTKGGADKGSLWSAITSRKRTATTTTSCPERTKAIAPTIGKGSTATREKRKGETLQAATSSRGRKRGLPPTEAPAMMPSPEAAPIGARVPTGAPRPTAAAMPSVPAPNGSRAPTLIPQPASGTGMPPTAAPSDAHVPTLFPQPMPQGQMLTHPIGPFAPYPFMQYPMMYPPPFPTPYLSSQRCRGITCDSLSKVKTIARKDAVIIGFRHLVGLAHHELGTLLSQNRPCPIHPLSDARGLLTTRSSKSNPGEGAVAWILRIRQDPPNTAWYPEQKNPGLWGACFAFHAASCNMFCSPREVCDACMFHRSQLIIWCRDEYEKRYKKHESDKDDSEDGDKADDCDTAEIPKEKKKRSKKPPHSHNILRSANSPTLLMEEVEARQNTINNLRSTCCLLRKKNRTATYDAQQQHMHDEKHGHSMGDAVNSADEADNDDAADDDHDDDSGGKVV